VIYSVWSYPKKEYSYYEGGSPSGTHAGAPPAPMTRGEIGAVPEAATWRLPMGARRVGSGPMPRGRIATISGVALGDIGELAGVGIWIGVAYLAWRAFR
jgi:hypothetical protein